jgi:PBSX family phage terminase large subunit
MTKTQTIKWGTFAPKHKAYIKQALKCDFSVAEGAIRCVDGDTLIYDPIKRKSIKARDFRGGHVYAFDGKKLVVAKASKAIRFKKVALYEITTKTGKKIVVSAGHRLLTPSSWLGISDMLNDASPCQVLVCESYQHQLESQGCQMGSILGNDQIVQHEDAQNSSRIIQDFQERCSVCSRPCDEQLQEGLNISQAFPPLRDDAREHTQMYLQTGDRVCGLSNIHSCLSSIRLSKAETRNRKTSDASYHSNGTKALSHNVHKSCECPCRFALKLRQFLLPFFHLLQVCGEYLVRPHHNICAAHSMPPLRCNKVLYPNYTLLYEKIQDIKFKKYDYYYDLHVPFYENYLANGFINHNSGKTIDHCIIAAAYLETCPDRIHLASGSTLPNAKLNIGVCNGFGLENLFRGRCRWGKYKDNEALFLYTQTGEKIIIFAGGGKADSYKKILGNSYGLWIATEINEHYDCEDSRMSFVKVATGRQTAAEQPLTLWDLNPCNPNHTIYSWYIDKFRDDYAGQYQYEHFTIDDNATMTDDRKAILKSKYTEGSVWYRRDILGERCVAQGLCYQEFADNPDKFIIDKAPELWFAVISVDFGGNKSGDAFNCTGFTRNFQQVVTLEDEWKDGKKTPEQLNKDFVTFVKKCREKYKVIECRADSAEQTLIQGLKVALVREKIPLDVKGAIKGEINGRIQLYNTLMAQERYKIMQNCQHTVKALSSAVWDQSKYEDVRLDNGTSNIDSLDAQEYTTEKYMKDILKARLIK